MQCLLLDLEVVLHPNNLSLLVLYLVFKGLTLMQLLLVVLFGANKSPLRVVLRIQEVLERELADLKKLDHIFVSELPKVLLR